MLREVNVPCYKDTWSESWIETMRKDKIRGNGYQVTILKTLIPPSVCTPITVTSVTPAPHPALSTVRRPNRMHPKALRSAGSEHNRCLGRRAARDVDIKAGASGLTQLKRVTESGTSGRAQLGI